MKAGQVTRLRVNPKDCQSILDVLDKIGMPYHNLSFSQCTSIALASLLETARMHKSIPEPDPFQFLNRMQPFVGQGTAVQRKRLSAANTLGNIGEHFQAPVMQAEPARQSPESQPQVSAGDTVSLEVRQARTRLAELVSKKDLSENSSHVTWTAEDEQEFQELYRVVYPEG